jgi:hypothetical protein
MSMFGFPRSCREVFSDMAYSDFTLEKVKDNFQINTIEITNIFADTPNIECSELLKQILEYNLPIAIASNSEKARSEMIISPILLDLRRQLNDQINLFSGVEFNVDTALGLNGICDFIITEERQRAGGRSQKIYFLPSVKRV